MYKNVFNNIKCRLGYHDWIVKWEKIHIKKTIEANRKFRICKNCLKCQHTGFFTNLNIWIEEDEQTINNRIIMRQLKLKKIKNKLNDKNKTRNKKLFNI